MVTMLSTGLLLTACGDKGPSDEELARQEIFNHNVSSAPEWTEEQERMIAESRGVVIGEEYDDNEEIIQIKNSYSPGDDTVVTLSAMTKEELLELDAVAHMEIFINGVIRDEYMVAAHTLYGSERVSQYKEAFKTSLMSVHPDAGEDEDSTYPAGTRYVDLLSLNTDLKDANVARHHIDTILKQVNRIFVKIIPISDFGNKFVVSGEVYPISLSGQLREVKEAAYGFTGVHARDYRSDNTEKELEVLNSYYIETFSNALVKAPISEAEPVRKNLGGFTLLEDGTWEPAQMDIFSSSLIRLLYGI